MPRGSWLDCEGCGIMRPVCACFVGWCGQHFNMIAAKGKKGGRMGHAYVKLSRTELDEHVLHVHVVLGGRLDVHGPDLLGVGLTR